MADETPYEHGKLLPSERARDALHNVMSLLRTHTGPDDECATIALSEGKWLFEQLDKQVAREGEAVAMIAQELFKRRTGRQPLEATPDEETQFMAEARAAFQLAGVAYNHG